MSDAETRERAQKLPDSWERTTIETISNHDPHANWWVGAASGLAKAYLDSVERERQLEEIVAGYEDAHYRIAAAPCTCRRCIAGRAALSSRPGSAANTEPPS